MSKYLDAVTGDRSDMLSPSEVQALTFEEARARLRVSRSTMFRLTSAGLLSSFKVGRTRLYLESEVAAFLLAAADGRIDWPGR